MPIKPEQIIKAISTVKKRTPLIGRSGFTSVKIPGFSTTDWKPATDKFMEFVKSTNGQFSCSDVWNLGNALQELYPFGGFDKFEFIPNFATYFNDEFKFFDKNIPQDKQIGQLLLSLGSPRIRTSIPQDVANFYQTDVMPRIASNKELAPLTDRLSQILDGSNIYYGYQPMGIAGVYDPDSDMIVINNRHAGSDPSQTFAHEVHHALRDGYKAEDPYFWGEEIYTPEELSIMQNFSPMNLPGYDPVGEIGSTAAETRFKYWRYLNNLYKKQNSNLPVTSEDVNKYIDTLPDRVVLDDLFNSNAYFISPVINRSPVAKSDLGTENMKNGANMVRDLLKYVPAITAIAVPTTTATLAGSKEKQEERL